MQLSPTYAFTFSLITALLSTASLIISLVNMKRTSQQTQRMQKMEALQKQGQFLIQLKELKGKLAVARIDSDHLGAQVEIRKSGNFPRTPEIDARYSEAQKANLGMEKRFAQFQEIIDTLEDEYRKFSEMTPASRIEKLTHQINDLAGNLDRDSIWLKGAAKNLGYTESRSE